MRHRVSFTLAPRDPGGEIKEQKLKTSHTCRKKIIQELYTILECNDLITTVIIYSTMLALTGGCLIVGNSHCGKGSPSLVLGGIHIERSNVRQIINKQIIIKRN